MPFSDAGVAKGQLRVNLRDKDRRPTRCEVPEQSVTYGRYDLFFETPDQVALTDG
jgi:hypothetical protein